MKRILIVDDEELLRDILKKILEREGFYAETAGDGQEAVETFKGGRFDLLITDLRMPRVGGNEMLREIERIDPEIRVIIVTGYPPEAEVQEKIQEGRYLFFAKPFDNEELLKKVKEQTDSKPLIRV